MKKVIVIGSGILGATTAYQLAKRGVHVTVIDRNDQGQATDAAAGIICPWLAQRRNKAWYRLARGGAHYYPQLIAELAKDGEMNTGYMRVGALRLHNDKKKLKETKERALKRRLDAPEIGEITMLNEKETQAMFPVLNDKYQSIHISGAARVDGRALRNSLLHAAKKHGAKIINGNARLIRMENRITGVSVEGEVMKAETVIATSGAWMNELFKPLGVYFQAFPQKAQILHLQIPNIDPGKWPVVMPPNNQYLLTFSDRIVIGATHEREAGFDNRVTAGGVHEVLAKALEVAPGLSESTILETKIGFRPFTPGSLPVVGSLPGFEGLLLANGLGASGLTTGPYLATQLAKLVLEERLDINLEDYDVAGAIK